MVKKETMHKLLKTKVKDKITKIRRTIKAFGNSSRRVAKRTVKNLQSVLNKFNRYL